MLNLTEILYVTNFDLMCPLHFFFKKNPTQPGRGGPTSIAMTVDLWPWSRITHGRRSPHTHGHGCGYPRLETYGLP
jgi:hypothetical protein